MKRKPKQKNIIKLKKYLTKNNGRKENKSINS